MTEKKLNDMYKELLKDYETPTYEKTLSELYHKIPKRYDYNTSPYIPYPSYTDKQFNKVIANKKEFSMNRTKKEGNKSYDEIADMKCNPSVFNLTPNQKFVRNFLSPKTHFNSLLLYHGVGVGKCHAYDTPILMHDGSIKMVQDITEGELLMGDDSTPRTVLSLGRGEDEMYDIVSEHNITFNVNAEHILCLLYQGDTFEITVKDFIALPLHIRSHMLLYKVPVFFNNPDPSTQYDPSLDHIPLEHLRSSYENRQKILKLLMNDGIIIPKNSSHSDDIQYLVNSLGLTPITNTYGHIEVSTENEFCFYVKHTGRSNYYGFTLDGNHRYIMGNFIITHNTCTAISIAEQYHDIYQKRVLVILSGTLETNFKKQIFSAQKDPNLLCTGTKYLNMVYDQTEDVTKKVQKIINSRYEFLGYKELANQLDNIKRSLLSSHSMKQKPGESVENYRKRFLQYLEDAELVEDNKIIEHFKNNVNERFREQVKKQAGIKIANMVFENDIETNTFDPTDILLTIEKQKKAIYKEISDKFSNRLIIIDEAHNLRLPEENGDKRISVAFLDLIKNITNTKLVLLTATPMFNQASEILWTLNLLLANDKRPTLTEKDLFEKDGTLKKDTLAEYSRGYVSYMRGENPYSFPFRLSPRINNDTNLLKQYPKITMKKEPIKDPIKHIDIIVSQMSPAQKETYDNLLKKNKESIIQSLLQVSNMVFTNGGYGRSGFNDTFYGSSLPYHYRGKTQILSQEHISGYSPKIQKIVDYILNSKGIVFVYSRYLYSGVIPLAIALEHVGFKKYGNKNITKNIDVDNKGVKGQYIVISGDANISPNNDVEIEASRNVDNKDGEKIKVIIVTQVGAEGIDFKMIREVHVMEPWFNLNRIEQVIGRAVRNCSHIALDKSERNVTIYLHGLEYDKEKESVDLKTYREAERKQQAIMEVEEVLRENAIDCNLNKDALLYKNTGISFNIVTSQRKHIKDFKVGDKDESFLCGFKACKMSCSPDVSPTEDNVSTYSSYYVSADIDKSKMQIEEIFKKRISYTYDEIHKKLPHISHDVLSYALDQLVSNQENINQGYLIYRGNKYIHQPINIHDIRATFDEREGRNVAKPKKLDLINFEVEKPPSVEKNVRSKDDIKTTIEKQIEVNKKTLLTILADEFDIVVKTETVNELLSNPKKGFTEKAKKLLRRYENCFMLMVLDRLDADQLVELVNTKKTSPIMERMLDWMTENGFYIPKRFFFNHVNKKVYKYENMFVEALVKDKLEFERQITDVTSKMVKKPYEDTAAFVVYIEKDKKFVFKTRKQSAKHQGSVCTTQPVSDILDRLNGLNQDIRLKPKYKSRGNLCFLQELLLREVPTENVFLSSFFAKFDK